MSTNPGDSGTAVPGARARRPWYQLEDRHAVMARGRVAVLMALAVVAALAPLDMTGSERVRAVAVCAGAIALHLMLAWIPGRHPRRLLAAVDVSLIVNAVAIGLLALLSGGTGSLAVWLLPLFCLAATVALEMLQGVKALILSALVIGWLTAEEGGSFSSLGDSDAIGPLALAAAIVVLAAALTRVNESWLKRQGERMEELHAASLAFAGADADAAPSLTDIAGQAARALLPGWDVTVGTGGEGLEERRWRADGRAFIEIPVAGHLNDDQGERRMGAITASRPVPRDGRLWVRSDSLTAVRMLATALSAALVQRELLERLEHLSMSDALTGLGNRRAFDEALSAEMARARRAKGSMGLVILDVDHFKQFNDRHGHQAGDDALVTVARVLADEARAEDRACRIGGEEFALLLPGADGATAAAVAERVRRAIEENSAPVAGVTVSLGVASSRGDDPRNLLETADARLYVAKEAGRNRVVAS